MLVNALGYLRQSTWSSPGVHAPYLESLPADPGHLAASLGNLLIHPVLADATGVPVPPEAREDKRIRRISDLIALLLARGPASLTDRRAETQRAFVVCWHFALLATSRLRLAGVPARMRVGFAAYFTPGFNEDHWVCEYRSDQGWKLLDAELDAAMCERLGIPFRPDDVPRMSFMTAGTAWQAIRSGDLPAGRMGVSAFGIGGLWFVAASLVRDLAALTMDEMLPWDYWGVARALGPGSTIAPDELERFDQLAGLLSPAPDNLELAISIQRSFPSVEVTTSVLSFPDGRPVEELVSIIHHGDP